MPVSSRKYPWIAFRPERPCGSVILEIENLTKTIDGEKVLNSFSMVVNSGDKVAFVGDNSLAKTALFQILTGEMAPDAGTFRWGQTVTTSYFPKENSRFFESDMPLVQWLLQYAPEEGMNFARSFLGRMLFSGEEAMKKTGVLSGGERVRCMLSRMMLSGSNALLLDEPTNHLDLEAITSLNEGLMAFPEVILFASHDHQFVSTVANRIVELTPEGSIDRLMSFDDYLESTSVAKEREAHYCREAALAL